MILINAYSEDEEYLYQSARMKQEFERVGVVADVMRNDDFRLEIERSTINNTYSEYDCCIYWDKDKYILNMLKTLGIRTFNGESAIEKCDDKMITYIEMAGHGIPLPRTLPGQLCYDQDAAIKEQTVAIVEDRLGYPVIIKNSYGSRGKGVFLVRDRVELLTKMEEVKCIPHLFQEYVPSSYGKDLRVIVIGDKVIGGMLRKSKGDFRSNIGVGGTGENYPLTPKIREMCLKIAEILGLDYCGIDLLFGEKDFLVCEVNSNAFFFAFEKATGINVAKAYVTYVIDKIKGDSANERS